MQVSTEASFYTPNAQSMSVGRFTQSIHETDWLEKSRRAHQSLESPRLETAQFHPRFVGSSDLLLRHAHLCLRPQTTGRRLDTDNSLRNFLGRFLLAWTSKGHAVDYDHEPKRT